MIEAEDNGAHPPLSHDLPCMTCGHGPHNFYDCECGCSKPPVPGIYID